MHVGCVCERVWRTDAAGLILCSGPVPRQEGPSTTGRIKEARTAARVVLIESGSAANTGAVRRGRAKRGGDKLPPHGTEPIEI